MRKPNYFNSEGYPDPTHYYAELHMMEEAQKQKEELYSFRPIVYICSPYAGDIKENVRNARRYSRFAVKKGYLPIAPHLLFPQFLNDADLNEREVGIYMGLIMLTKCVELWVFGERISEGMQREIKKAKVRGVLIRRFTSDLQEEVK